MLRASRRTGLREAGVGDPALAALATLATVRVLHAGRYRTALHHLLASAISPSALQCRQNAVLAACFVWKGMAGSSLRICTHFLCAQ